MNIYDELSVRPFINAGGWMYTRYGGSIMPAPVLAAMTEASRHFVNIFDLQDRIGDAIASMTHNESAFVSCGAASGIVLAVAACIAGTDNQLADRLPQTEAMRNEIIMSRCHRGTEADPAVRAAGGRIIQIGPPDRLASSDDFLNAITDRTAAILLVAFESEAEIRATSIVSAAHNRNIPILIDGACAVPPRHNLWRYTRDLGVDAFITSGGKAIRGPQSTGLVLGTRRIIAGCKFHSSPNLRLGRGMKVGKEEFAGIYTALKLFLAEDETADAAMEKEKIARIADHLKDIPGLKLTVAEASQLEIRLNPAIVATKADQIAKTLLEGNPSILLRGRDNKITVRATLLQPGEDEIIAQRLREVLTVCITSAK